MKHVFKLAGGVLSALTLSVASLAGLAGSAGAQTITHADARAVTTVSGVIAGVVPGSPETFTVQTTKSAPVSITVGPNTVFLSLGLPSTAAALVVGDKVNVTASGKPFTAITVRVSGPVVVNVSGVVSGIATTSGTPTSFNVIESASPHLTVSLNLSSSTIFRQSNVIVTSAVLLVGSKVSVTAAGSPMSASLVTVAPPVPVYVNGVVTSVLPLTGTPTSVVVQPHNVKLAPVTVNFATATVFHMGGGVVPATDVQVGSQIDVTALGTPLVASKVVIDVPKPVHVSGIVTQVSATSITVAPSMTSSKSVTWALTTTTAYYEGGKAVTLGAVSAGDVVTMTAPAATATTASTVRVLNTALIGRVKGISGDVLTVRGIHHILLITTTSSTIIKKNGHGATLSNVKIGDLVVAIGPAFPLAPTTMTATKVYVGIVDNPGLEHFRD